MRIDLPTPSRALAIVAHPDDAEFQCGATFAKWAAQGCVVNHLICTDGAKGTWDAGADTAALVSTRIAEQREAANVLGSTGEVVHLGAVDGELEATLHWRERVAYWIRVLKPDVVLAHDPWRRWRLHSDHRAAGFLACDGVVAARDPHFHTHHDVPHHRPSELLLFETEEPDHFEDVSGYESVKVSALLAHRSQWRSTMSIDDNDDGTQRLAFDAHIREGLRSAGRRCGVVSAEAFRQIRDL